MKTMGLLDCTLRDGGYINDWEFGHSTIVSTYKRLDEAGVDYIEVGFLDDRRLLDLNRTIAPDTDSFNKIFDGVQKKHAFPVAMIDFGTCSLDHIGDAEGSFAKGIRVIFKKEKIRDALPFCKAIKEKGYRLFIQAISITAYSDMELLRYIEAINEIKPYVFSIVDTYGLLDNHELSHYFDLIDNNLDVDIKIGYHAHNNFQLAFSNSMKFLALTTRHDKVVDSTIYGMGKSAGNCPSELIAMHMNQQYGTSYDLNQMLEALDSELIRIYQEHYWGYRYNFYISALQRCHPSYVAYLLDKKTLTVSALNEILAAVPEEKKLLYDEKYIADAYTKYQSHAVDDMASMHELQLRLEGRTALLLGPGRSLRDRENVIRDFLKKHDAVCVGVNFVPAMFDCNFIFVSNVKRYNKLSDTARQDELAGKLILTSNITPIDIQADYVLNYQKLLDKSGQQLDNALLLCVSAMCEAGVSEVILAGFDGYTEREEDYFDVSYTFAENRDYLLGTNSKTAEGLRELAEKVAISFLTPSVYQEGMQGKGENIFGGGYYAHELTWAYCALLCICAYVCSEVNNNNFDVKIAIAE